MNKPPSAPLTKDDLIEALEKEFGQISTQESPVDMDRAAQAFIREWLLVRYDMRDATEAEKGELFAWAEGLMKNWDTDLPELAHSQKIINRLVENATGAASTYAENLQYNRAKEESGRQTKRGSAEKKNQLTALLKRLITSNPEITPNEVLDKFRQLQGGGIIVEVTEEDILYKPKSDSTIEKYLQISSLAGKLSRLKNSMK
jgi:hypothetical protein